MTLEPCITTVISTNLAGRFRLEVKVFRSCDGKSVLDVYPITISPHVEPAPAAATADDEQAEAIREYQALYVDMGYAD